MEVLSAYVRENTPIIHNIVQYKGGKDKSNSHQSELESSKLKEKTCSKN